MRRTAKIVVLSILAIALLLWASLETFHLYSAFHYIKMPNTESRKPIGHNIHSWMSIEELSERCQVPPDEMFAALNIEPEAGDEHLSLRHLAVKYNRSPTRMVEVLEQFAMPDQSLPNRGGR